MKPIAIVVLWAFLGWDLGAWFEAFVGTPALAGLLAGAALGAALALAVRRQAHASQRPQPQIELVRAPEPAAALDRAA